MASLTALDSLTVDVITDNVSDTYASKPAFAASELANVMLAGAKEISGETLLVVISAALRLRSASAARARAAVRHRHRRGGLPAQLPQPRDRPRRGQGHRGDARPLGPWAPCRRRSASSPAAAAGVAVHVNRHVQRARRAAGGRHDLPRRARPASRRWALGARVVNDGRTRRLLDGHFYYGGEIRA
jgi:7,8-dihydropterin-6-yl-methyl-4-(beta-D-ribofuranosyl)aminobenzene 5'-phosphate synthase